MSKRSPESIATAAIKRGKTNQEALAAVRRLYPASRLSLATINYYRNNLRRGHPHVLSDRECTRQRKA